MSFSSRSIVAFGIVLVVAIGAAAPAQADGALRLPANGTFQGGGEFEGTVTINRFAARGNEIVAIGFVSGVLSRGNKSLGTAVAGEVTWPVTVKAGNTSATRSRVELQQTSCPVLQIGFGPVDVNLLGAVVSLPALSFEIGGEEGTPLGDLVCAVSDLLGNVAAIVEVLNSLLGLLTGLLGGLGGLVPSA